MRNGGTCILRDDMANILNLYQKADVFVLATPVYFCYEMTIVKWK